MSGFDCGIRTSLKSSALTLPPSVRAGFFCPLPEGRRGSLQLDLEIPFRIPLIQRKFDDFSILFRDQSDAEGAGCAVREAEAADRLPACGKDG